MKTRIIVDSTADLMPEFKNRVYTVPLTVNFGTEEYIDGVTIDHKTFYEKLIESDVLPTTSQAAPAAFEAVFAQVAERGNTAVVLTVAAGLSGTYQSAVIAAEDRDYVVSVDTKHVSVGQGVVVREVARVLEENPSMTVEEAAAAAERIRDELKARGIEIIDTPQGAKWRKV